MCLCHPTLNLWVNISVNILTESNVCCYVDGKIESLWIRETPVLMELLGCSRNQWVWRFITCSPVQLYSFWCICIVQCREPPPTFISLTCKAKLFLSQMITEFYFSSLFHFTFHSLWAWMIQICIVPQLWNCKLAWPSLFLMEILHLAHPSATSNLSVAVVVLCLWCTTYLPWDERYLHPSFSESLSAKGLFLVSKYCD